ncbi:hypothetical protein [Natrononativus amylolyticus]|uniref:hypothetical protein n=1 Tax=Natrononativus amylolyticus TaxID=2963434 RepID=UPI0020CCD8FB|nr:hypothetical protein [Natrononativus amylolyticus]
MNTETTRNRGVLSPADRAYLFGEREMSHDQSRRNAEARIRERVRHAVLDFDVLLHTLSVKDRRQVFDDVATDDAFLDGLRAMVAFAYVGTKEQGFDFEDVLVPAVRSSEEAYAAKQLDATASVDVTFEVETTVETTLEGIAGRLEEGEPVTPRELFSLIMQGDHDPGKYDEITLVGVDDEGVDDPFLERLAAYLGGSVRHVTDSRAVIDLGADSSENDSSDGD